MQSKKNLIPVTLVLTILVTPFSTGCYFLIDGGTNGPVDANSVGIEMGGIGGGSDEKKYGYLIGLGGSFAFTEDDVPDYNDHSIPHSDYTRLSKTYNEENEMELYSVYGYNIFKGLFAVGGVGYSWQETVKLDQSNVTGWYYLREKETHGYLTGTGQLRWLLQDKWFLQAGYHSRRGIIAGIGYRFGESTPGIQTESPDQFTPSQDRQEEDGQHPWNAPVRLWKLTPLEQDQ